MAGRRRRSFPPVGMWRAIALPAAAAALLAVSAGAVADTVTRSDPKDDVRGVPTGAGFDLKSATAGHRSSSQVVHRITSHYPDPPGFEAVRLELDADPSDRFTGPDFHVRKAGSGAGIYNHRGRRVGRAAFTRISGSAFSLAFRLSALGNPPRYGWRVRVVGERRQTIDALPGRGYVRHTMPRPND